MKTEQTPIPVLGIPHYNRIDLLERLLASIDYPVDTLVLVDNGNGNRRQELFDLLVKAPKCMGSLQLIQHANAGVAASWNEIIKLFPASWWLISNDDIQFAPGDLAQMSRFVGDEEQARFKKMWKAQHPGTALGMVYGNHGASWFGITAHGVDTVGLFDENIFPAYLEDCDWSHRADLLGVRRCDVPDVHAVHGDEKLTGSCTVNCDAELAEKNSRTHGGNFNYYKRKWGGLNGTETFKTPFNDPHWPVWAWKFETETRAAQQW